MNHELYSVYDTKSELYTLPFFVNNKAMAIRYFSNWVNDRTHTFGLNPEDYILFHLGTYDDTLATITQDKIESIGNGLQFKINEENQ